MTKFCSSSLPPTKILKIEVKSCEGCLNHTVYTDYPEGDLDCCMEANKTIQDISQIPDWCPLPEKAYAIKPLDKPKT